MSPSSPRSAARAAAIALASAALVAACRAPVGPPPRGPEVATGIVDLERIPLALPDVSGLSGLSHDGEGRFLAIAERKRAVVAMDARGGNLRVLPLVGLDEGLDAESIAWLGDGRLAIGTEGKAAGAESERVVLARLEADRVVVDGAIAMPYAPWARTGAANRGLEGLCAADGIVLAAVEAPIVEPALGGGETRDAPLGRLDLESGRWTAFRLRLTTTTGKIAGLECRPRADGDLDVVAIERHYGVARVLAFRVSRTGVGGTIPPSVRADLAPLLRDGENPEGIEWPSPDELAIVTDNDYGGPRGDSLLLKVRLRPYTAAP